MALVAGAISHAVWTASARADTPALAETLYQQGRALMAKGRTADACVKFGESQHVEPATGTLLNLAVCHEKLGKAATAWAEFRAAETMSLHDGRDDRARMARQHWSSLETRLALLTVVVADGARVPGLEVSLDGTLLGPAAWNIASPIDPGDHQVLAHAAGYRPLSRKFHVGPARERVSAIVQMQPLADPAVASAEAAGPVSPLAVAPPETPAQPASGEESSVEPVAQRPPVATSGALRAGAYVAAAAGLAGLAVGTVFGVRAIDQWRERNRDCPRDVCTLAGATASDRAASAALIADIAFGAGFAALGTGGYLLYRSHARASGATSHADTLTVRLMPKVVASRSLAVGIDW